MIAYFTHNKGKTKFCEDSLTASVFGTLQYLPVDIFYSILKSSLLHDKLPNDAGELIDVLFWENWDAVGTTNILRVEPDILLRFEQCDIILEAKRYEQNQQNKLQMENQLQAYQTAYGEYEKTLYFIQVGGLNSVTDEIDNTVNGKPIPVCKTNWSRLLAEVAGTLIKFTPENSPKAKASVRVLNDVVAAFALHQYYKLTWLQNLKTTGIKNKSMKNFFNYG